MDPPPDVLYDSPRAGIAQKVVVSVATGAALTGFTLLVRWGFYPAAQRAWPFISLGVIVTVVMLVAAALSRTVRRVEVNGACLKLYRDPAAIEEHPRETIVSFASEAAQGGWSRDPSERLVVTFKNGTALRCDLPDDADTPGIVRDLTAWLDPATTPAPAR